MDENNVHKGGEETHIITQMRIISY